MADNTEFRKWLDELKSKTDLVQVIQETGAEFEMDTRKRGRYFCGRIHDSLLVDPDWGIYTWWSEAGNNKQGRESGDAFAWLERHGNMDFMQAVRHLAAKVGMEVPKAAFAATAETSQAVAAYRVRVDMYEAAARWFAKELRGSPAAMDYVHGRGWTDETVEATGLGFCDGSVKRKNDLIGEMQLYGFDLNTPEAVALAGFHGDVQGWCEAHQVDAQENWLEKNRIWGITDMVGLVYVHRVRGRVEYFSLRRLKREGDRLVSETEKSRKSFNPPTALAGSRVRYFNQAYHRNVDLVVIVEGQADAVSLGQWKVPSVALAGLSVDEALMNELRSTARPPEVYVGLDMDEHGQAALLIQADTLGPLTRVVSWPVVKDGDHDANDWLRRMVEAELQPDEQCERVAKLLGGATTVVECLADRAGAMEDGAARDRAIKQVRDLLAKVPADEQETYIQRVAKKIGRTAGSLSKELKKRDKGDKPEEVEDIMGGLVQDHFVEMVFDPESQRTRLAVRFPDGQMDEVPYLDLKGVRYQAPYPNILMVKNAVLFSGKLGKLLAPDDLVRRVRAHIHRYLDIDIFFERLASYYVLFSWVFDAFQFVPYLRALGDYGTGKTRFLQVIGSICYRPMFTAGASTTSPIFRMLDRYRGTLVLDEADFGRSDAEADIIKILNTGYMRGMPVLRTVDRGPGGGGWDIEAYDVFGPKLIATRKRFVDKATESRCLTKEMGSGIPREDIPVVLPKAFWEEARELRDYLLAYRMANWTPERDVDYNDVDRSIEARLNQVTMALTTIIGHDMGMRNEIKGFVGEYNRQLVTDRSLSLTAKVVEALVVCWARKSEAERSGEDGRRIFLKDIKAEVNRLIDDQNRSTGDEDEDDEKKSGGAVKSRRVGDVVRNYLQLQTERATSGQHKGMYYAIWDDTRVRGLCSRYGVAFEGNGGGAVVDINAPGAGEAFRAEREKWEQASLKMRGEGTTEGQGSPPRGPETTPDGPPEPAVWADNE